MTTTHQDPFKKKTWIEKIKELLVCDLNVTETIKRDYEVPVRQSD